MMDHLTLGERDHSIDLESGGTTSEEDASILFGSVGFDGSFRGEECTTSSLEVLVENQGSIANKKCEGGETIGIFEQKKVKDKCKQTSSRKPPRPPRGLSLDAADQKLIKEISELAKLRRARLKRIKEMKKMKAAKAASVNSNLYATVITVLFCLIIIFQGVFSRGNSQVAFTGSPAPDIATSGGLISVQYYKNLSASDPEERGSLPPNFIDEVARSSK